MAPLFHAALELLSTLVATYAAQLPYSVLTQVCGAVLRVGRRAAALSGTARRPGPTHEKPGCAAEAGLLLAWASLRRMRL